MAGRRIITQQNDTVDAICWRHYGTSAMVETLLEANPGLARLGPVLPIGITVTLPEKTTNTSERRTISLWD